MTWLYSEDARRIDAPSDTSSGTLLVVLSRAKLRIKPATHLHSTGVSHTFKDLVSMQVKRCAFNHLH